MIDSFFNTVRTTFVLIVIAIAIIIVVALVKYFSDMAEKKEQQRRKAEREKEIEFKRRESGVIFEQRRDKYWNNLCLVYGDKDRESLSNILYWLEEFNRLPNIGEDGYNSYVSQERQECREKIKALLDYPEWIVEGDDKSNTPIWLDLDIKYIKLLLQ